MAPHSLKDLLASETWERSYSREQAAYPLPWLKEKKFWPSVTRLDDGEDISPPFNCFEAHAVIAYGDMNLFCSCGPVESIDGMTGAAAPAAT
jgi:glycine dehydrogenase